jgi:hypothetical protein
MSRLVPGTDVDREQQQAQIDQATKHSFHDVTPFHTDVKGPVMISVRTRCNWRTTGSEDNSLVPSVG